MKPKTDGSGSDAIAKQAARLIKAKLSNSPKGSVELERVLRLAAQSSKHAEAIIDFVIASRNSCPTPAELANLAAAVPPPANYKPVVRATCGLCVDGWVEIYLLVELNGGIPISGKETRISAEEYKNLSPRFEGGPEPGSVVILDGKTGKPVIPRIKRRTVHVLDPRTQGLYTARERCGCFRVSV